MPLYYINLTNMKAKKLFLALLTVCLFPAMLMAQDSVEPEMKIKKEYDFTTLVTDKNAITLSCSGASVDVNGVTCYKSDFAGYEGLAFEKIGRAHV